MFTGICRWISATILFGITACVPAVTSTARVTSVPTLAPSPTQSLESPTPIPTANFVPADIYDTWTRSDPDRGDLFIIFNPDGTFIAAHGSPEVVMQAGHYTIDGRTLTFIDGWECSPTEEIPGVYLIRVAGGGKYMLLEPLEDRCPDRPSAFKGYRWDRFEPTP